LGVVGEAEFITIGTVHTFLSYYSARSGPILWRSALKSVIYDVLRARKGWREAADGEPWDFFWAEKGCVCCVCV
jgi:hypothetical protein